jgi:signal transduction histidine kinase/AmiR/NasT family two-component response regulator
MTAATLNDVFEARRRSAPAKIFSIFLMFITFGVIQSWIESSIWLVAYLGMQIFEYVFVDPRKKINNTFGLMVIFLGCIVGLFLSALPPKTITAGMLQITFMMGGAISICVSSRASFKAFFVNGSVVLFYLFIWPIRNRFPGEGVVEATAMTIYMVLGFAYTIAAWKVCANNLTEVTLARAQAEAAGAAKSAFMANMSHELRTPLNGVVAMTSILSRTPLRPDQFEMLEVIKTSAQSLQTLLSDVLDLAKIESGKIGLQSNVTTPATLARHVTSLFSAPAAEKGLSISLKCQGDVDAGVLADSVRVTQILTNLCSNAVKFTERGGVTLSVDVTPCDDRRLVVFSVSDTGIGISADAQARIFHRFAQADGSITRRFGGTGLGLSISRHLAELMGGRITLTSVEGQGSTFRVELELPAAEAPVAATGDEADQVMAWTSHNTPRILLVEDHPVNRKVVQLMLAEQVILDMAEDGEQGVAASGAQAYDLILMDMQMPVMDGLTATRAIRDREAQAGLKPTPIIMLTANALPEHVSLSRAAGANGHLNKPITADRLYAVLDDFLGAEAGNTASALAPTTADLSR